MTSKQKIDLLDEGMEIRKWFSENASEFANRYLNRLIEIELQLEKESNK